MKKKFGIGLIILLLSSLISACTPPAKVSETPAPAKTATQKPSAQDEWNQLVKDAKAEGKLLIASAAPGEIQTALTTAFREKFGVDIEFIAGRGAEVAAKFDAERRAGLYLTDILIPGWVTYVSMIKPLDATEAIEPLLILPEVKDTSKWNGGKLPFLDKAGHALALTAAASPPHIINTNQVKKGEISGIRDLLAPKWKGKIVIIDPTLPGPSAWWYGLVLTNILGPEQGRIFMKELAANAAAATKDYRLGTEWVAQGKYAICTGVRADEPLSFIKAGAPIEFVDNAEPRNVIPGFALLNVARNRPHPKATQLFLNWILTQEGMTFFTKITQKPTPRIDAPTEGLLPVMIPRPNDVPPSEESEAELPRMVKMAGEDFGNLLK